MGYLALLAHSDSGFEPVPGVSSRGKLKLSVEQPVRRVPPGAVRADPRLCPKSRPSSRISRTAAATTHRLQPPP